MQPRLEATLADFVPALRFLPPDRVDRRLGHPDLPPAWWTSVPISRAVDAIGATELPDRLAELAYGELRHLRLGDLLPAAWLARNDFRLSQWPSGVRTNVLVRTPDWADLLGTTVQEIGDWTNIGTTTVRPVISQLFAEVLGLLPADRGAGDATVADAAEAPETTADADAADDAADAVTHAAEVADPTTESAQAAEPEPGDVAGEGAASRAEAPVEPAVPAPRGIRISKRPPVAPTPDAADAAGPSAAEALPAAPAEETSYAEEETYAEEYDGLVDAIEDELRPVSIPAPPTGDLSAVVCWLAEEAPDVPLMSELTRVTLEIVAVVGVDSATPEVRTSLLRLMSLVPASLLPEGLDPASVAALAPDSGSEDPDDASPDPDDPYDAPEMTSVLGAVPPPVPDDAAGPDAADPTNRGAGADATVLVPPGTTPPPPPWAADSDDLTVLAMPAAAPPPDDSPEPDAAVDAFGEVPPMTRDDFPALPAPDAPAADAHGHGDDEAVDAFGEIPPATRDDFPIPATPRGAPSGDSPAPRKDARQTVHEPGDAADEAAASHRADAASPAKPAKSSDGSRPDSPAAQGFVIPPRPTAPPPLPPRPADTPPTAAGSAAPEPTEAPASAPAREAAETFAGEPGTAPDEAEDSDTDFVPAHSNIVMVLAAWFTGREPRWRTLARDRLFTDSPRELASLAAEFDKDSIEVEALEQALRQHLAHQLDQPGGAAVRAHLGSVEARLGPVATVAELRDLDRRHAATIPGLGVQLWQVLRGLLALNTSVDGWLTAGAPGELESRTAEIVSAACARTGSVPFAALEPPLSALGIRPEVREAWISRLDGFDLEDGVVHPWPADESGPVPAAQAPDAGRAPAPPTREIAPEEAPAVADPGDAARCFRDEQGVWWYRVDVEAPLLDGERLPLPPQFVQVLGLRPDGGLRLHHAAGPAALRWEREPYCVSLRAILHGLGAEIGDMVFIGSVRQGRMETRLLAGDGKLRLPRWARALRHTGVDPVPDQVNLPALLGSRLGLGDGCDLKAVLKRLQDRGDTDVLELLGVGTAH
ncbi:hypothetical protein LO772_25275 [Yinghuangia sp. ASG 101]|uniref:hypothetical protein n=1 Tax=Yinghuangia sp. ASG 101 TaxID=2896848 RepID=UPI001E29A4E3|nr:hypothetical protein [Yinghuangia sp. ASG 101]UGQ10167.1 hypothetical protein LO772_25275 [Yinghuangia sp. ASG 101]